MKSGNLNFLEPSGPLQACNGIALLFFESSPHPLVSVRILCRIVLSFTFWSLETPILLLFVFMTDKIKIISYSPVTPFSLVGNYHTFKGTCLF